MGDSEVILEGLKQLQAKYKHLVEIYKLTKEMEDSLARNDNVSVQMLIGMRQEEMEQVDKYNKSLYYLNQTLSSDKSQFFTGKLNIQDNTNVPETFEEKKIVELQSNIRNTLNQTIALDSHMSKRIAGADSFYSARK